jgi:DNA helicase HerA-like ATPase
VFGPVASGKTHLVKQWVANENRLAILDLTGEFVNDPTLTKVYRDPKLFASLLKQTPYVFRIAYEPGKNIQEHYFWVVNSLWVTPSDKLLVADEFHKLCPVNAIDEDVEQMLRLARHDKLGFMGVSQRIADVHKLFTSSCRMIVLFQTYEARDLLAVRDRWGKSTADMVANLRRLDHDDDTNITHTIPQCVVIEPGKQPRVFDFETDSFVNGSNGQRRESEPFEDVEDEDEIEPEDSTEVQGL